MDDHTLHLFCGVGWQGMASGVAVGTLWLGTPRLGNQTPFRSVWGWHQGANVVEWRLEAPLGEVQLQKDAWPGMPFFFPILEAAVRVGNCRLVLTQWNGFSIKAKSKEGCLRECAVCIHIRAMSRLHREKKQWMKRLGWLAEPLID